MRGIGPHRQSEPRDFRQAASDERRTRIVAESETLQNSRRDRDDVLERSRELDPDHVVAAVDPKGRRREDSLRVARRLGIRRGGDHRGRLPLTHLSGEARPRERGESHSRRAFGVHLDISASVSVSMPLVALTTSVPGFRSSATCRSDAPYRMARRRRDDHARRPATAARGICFGAQGGRKRDAGQEHRVLAVAIDRCDDLRLVRPDPDRLTLAREQVGQRRPPASRAQYRDDAHRVLRGSARAARIDSPFP